MAMKNAKTVKNALKVFFKEQGRYPDFNEFRNIILGRNTKKVKDAPKANEAETK